MSSLPTIPELREKIARHLDTVEEATAKKITASIKCNDYPSLVIKALNAMRTDGDVEAEQRKGELAYWLARPLAQVLDPSRQSVTEARPVASKPDAVQIVAPAPKKGNQKNRIALQQMIQGRTKGHAISMRDAAKALKITTKGVAWLLRAEEAAGTAARMHLRDGKQGSWIYDPRTEHPQHAQPEVASNTGSSALADSLSPPAEGAAVQPEPAPDVSVAPSTAPVAADVKKPWLGYNAGPRDRAVVKESLTAEPREIPAPQYDPNDVAFHQLENPSNDFCLLAVIDDIREAIGDPAGKINLGDLAEHIRLQFAARNAATEADAQLDQIRDLLADYIGGEIDPGDMSEVEMARSVAMDLNVTKRQLEVIQTRERRQDDELRNARALNEKLEALLQSARHEAEHLRAHSQPADADMVNSPPHYQGKVECIDAIEAALGPDGFAAYCRGNAIKYSFRAGRKGDAAQDLAKAAWYLQRVTA